jgi:Cu(I)/Ag(I) efflux system membrane fusion protein
MILVFGAWYLGLGCGEKPKPETLERKPTVVYYCPMHPDVQQDHPGKCPKKECNGMELVPKILDAISENVLKPVNASVLASVKTSKPVFRKMNLGFEATGYIDYDSRTNNNISSLYSGRIEKLYVKYLYQPVRKGEKVFEIYSPELVTAQENLIYLLNNDPLETGLITAAKQKLQILGFMNDLLDELVKTKKVIQAVPVFSNYEGHVHETKMGKPSSSGMSGTDEKKNDYIAGAELSVKEGMYVMMGETIFNVVNQDKLAVMLQVKAEDMPRIHTGQEVAIEVDGGIKINGKIDFIEPVLKEGAKTMIARVYCDNSRQLYKVGSLVKAKLKGEELEALWIPLTALVDLGKEKTVWVKQNGNFVASKVETGARADGMIEISDGLTEESEIATEAHYLTDSEGFIKTNQDEK